MSSSVISVVLEAVFPCIENEGASPLSLLFAFAVGEGDLAELAFATVFVSTSLSTDVSSEDEDDEEDDAADLPAHSRAADKKSIAITRG